MDNNQFLFKAPNEVLEELRAINQRIDQKGYVLKQDAERYMELSRKYQVCNTCERPFSDIKMKFVVKLPGYGNNEYSFCYDPTCLECGYRNWLKEKGELDSI